MEIERSLIDKDFDRYVLSSKGTRTFETLLPSTVMEPLDAVKTTRKAHWEARIHHNTLVADPFLSDALDVKVAYFIDAEYRLMQVIGQSVRTSIAIIKRTIS